MSAPGASNYVTIAPIADGYPQSLINEGIEAGVLDAYLVILGSYVFQGGSTPTPLAFEQLRKAVASTAFHRDPERHADASDAIWERAVHIEGYDHLALLINARSHLRFELELLLEDLDRIDACGPSDATVAAFLSSLDSITLFVWSARHALEMAFVEAAQGVERTIH